MGGGVCFFVGRDFGTACCGFVVVVLGVTGSDGPVGFPGLWGVLGGCGRGRSIIDGFRRVACGFGEGS